MIDIKKLRDNFEDVKSSLITRGYSLDDSSFKSLEDKRKLLQVEVEKLQADRKKLSGEFGKLKSSGEDTSSLKKTIDLTNADLESKDSELQDILNLLNAQLLDMPNIPHESVPKGKSEKDNVFYREWGIKPNFKFTSKRHYEIGEKLNLMNFDLATKLSGTRFVVLRDKFALLERALINFMLDTHVNEFNYSEISPPLIVNEDVMFGTGQLPKFEDDQFEIKFDNSDQRKFLIPTAEVVLTNLVRESIIEKKQLPKRLFF